MSVAVWDITSNCNLRCKHCYNGEKYFEHEIEDLSFSESINLVNLLSSSGIRDIHLLGGEPLLKENLFDIITQIGKMGMSTSITTNGLLLNSSNIKKIISHNISMIFISLDGGSREVNDLIRGPGTFDKVVENTRLLVREIQNAESPIEVVLGFTVSSYNLKDVTKVVDLCKSVGVNAISVTTLMKCGSAVDNWEEIHYENSEMFDAIENMARHASLVNPSMIIHIDARPFVVWLLRKKYSVNFRYSTSFTKCWFLKGGVYIQANGQVHPCGLHAMEIGKDMQNKGYFNSSDSVNIRNVNSLSDIKSSKYYRDFSASLRKLEKKSYHIMCKSCPVANDCYPCPFQFLNGVPDCDWAFSRYDEFILTIKNIKVVRKVEVNLSGANISNFDKIVYNTLTIGDTIEKIASEIGMMELKSINNLKILEALRNLEKRFFVELDNGGK